MKIITGSPGTGKHTIARIIAEKNCLDLVDINRIAIVEEIVEKGSDALDVDVKKLGKILDRKISKNTLFVGHLAPYVVSRNKVECAVVLRRSPYNLEKVYAKRGYSKKKSVENLGSEILGVTYYDTIKNIGSKKTFQFDTTSESIKETVKRIERLFVKGRAREDSVDWLKTVSKKGDLKRFFPY